MFLGLSAGSGWGLVNDGSRDAQSNGPAGPYVLVEPLQWIWGCSSILPQLLVPINTLMSSLIFHNWTNHVFFCNHRGVGSWVSAPIARLSGRSAWSSSKLSLRLMPLLRVIGWTAYCLRCTVVWPPSVRLMQIRLCWGMWLEPLRLLNMFCPLLLVVDPLPLAVMLGEFSGCYLSGPDYPSRGPDPNLLRWQLYWNKWCSRMVLMVPLVHQPKPTQEPRSKAL